MKLHKKLKWTAAALFGMSLTQAAMAQQTNWVDDALSGKMYINEVLVNPASSDDNKYEYIEIFGCPNQSLDGIAIVVVSSPNSTSAEVDESFYFGTSGKYQLNSDGYFVLWNSPNTGTLVQQANASLVYGSLPTSVSQTLATGLGSGGGDDIDELTTRYEASFREVGSCGSGGCSTDGPGSLENDGSMSFILINFAASKRADGVTALTLSDIQKDATIDTTSDGAFNGQIAYQLSHIDSVAWSNNNGHEYTKHEGEEIDFTPNSYKPDAISRVGKMASAVSTTYDAVNVGTGGGSDDFRSAYTNWVNGDLDSNHPGSYVKGYGGLHYPTSVNVNFDVDTDIDGYAMTPGYANSNIHGRGQICGECSSPCEELAARLQKGDLDGDGKVDEADLVKLFDMLSGAQAK